MNGEEPRRGTGEGELDPVRRAAFARELMRALAAHCPGSRAELRGSLARGTSDAYSDVDLAWTVPGDRFDACLASVREVLEAVRPLDSLRTDPESRDSRERRLVFAAFRGLPLFWRVDLEIAASPAARGEAAPRRTVTTGRRTRARWPTRSRRPRPYCADSRRTPGGCWSAASGAPERRTARPGGGSTTSAGSPGRRPPANRP